MNYTIATGKVTIPIHQPNDFRSFFRQKLVFSTINQISFSDNNYLGLQQFVFLVSFSFFRFSTVEGIRDLRIRRPQLLPACLINIDINLTHIDSESIGNQDDFEYFFFYILL